MRDGRLQSTYTSLSVKKEEAKFARCTRSERQNDRQIRQAEREKERVRETDRQRHTERERIRKSQVQKKRC